VIALDRNRYRLGLAEKMGADKALQATDDDYSVLRRELDGDADCALEMSGASSAVVAAVHIVRPGGWISLLGIGDQPTSLDLSTDVVSKGLSLFGVFGRRQFSTWETTARYVAEGKISVEALLTHEFPLGDIEAAIALMKSGQCGKISLSID